MIRGGEPVHNIQHIGRSVSFSLLDKLNLATVYTYQNEVR